jgi:hypothetical protein
MIYPEVSGARKLRVVPESGFPAARKGSSKGVADPDRDLARIARTNATNEL